QQGLYLKSDRWQPAGIFSFSIAPALPFAIKTQTGMSVLLLRHAKAVNSNKTPESSKSQAEA
ncbi:MAG: hypothetical protein WCP55_25225, partial [Lentisphaerota bacterium]